MSSIRRVILKKIIIVTNITRRTKSLVCLHVRSFISFWKITLWLSSWEHHFWAYMGRSESPGFKPHSDHAFFIIIFYLLLCRFTLFFCLLSSLHYVKVHNKVKLACHLSQQAPSFSIDYNLNTRFYKTTFRLSAVHLNSSN